MIGKSRLVFTLESKEYLLHILEENRIRWNPENYFSYTLFIKLEFNEGDIELQKLTQDCDIMLIYLADGNKLQKLRVALQMIKKLDLQHNFNFIETYDPHLLGILGLILKFLLKTKLLLHINNDTVIRYNKLKILQFPALKVRFMERFLELTVMFFSNLISADRISYLKSGMVPVIFKSKYRCFGISAHPIHFTPLSQRKSLRRDWKIDDHIPVILYIGRFEKNKYVHHLARAFQIILQSFPEAVIVIIGEGTEKKKIEKELSAIPKKNYRLLNAIPIEETIHAFYTADVHMTGHGGLTLVEAALAKVPNVVYDFEWQSEFIIDRETGMLAEIGNYQMLGEKVVEILKDKKLYSKIQQKAYKKAIHYSLEKNYKKEISIWNELTV